MNMKIILKEWNKFLVEETEKEFYADLKRKRKQRSKQDKQSTPPTPLPAGSNWDGKSAYSYNDAKGLHFFTPGVGWQTIQDRPSEPVPKEPANPYDAYPIDRKTAERYESLLNKMDLLMGKMLILNKKCSTKPATENEISKCRKLFEETNRLEEEIIRKLNDEEDAQRFEYYYDNKDYRDYYRQKLQITPADESTMS